MDKNNQGGISSDLHYTHNDDIVQLQSKVESLLKENNELRINQAVSQEVMQRQVEQLQVQQVYMQQKMELVNYRAEQVMAKYHTLASSTLGRLTLKIWEWRTHFQSVKLQNGKLAALRWLLKPSSWNVNTSQRDMDAAQQNWIDGYIDRIAAIPNSNGCRYFEKLSCRIGVICDSFFYSFISSAADFVYLTPDNWQCELEKGLDAMLFVTAWRGLHEEWRGLGATRDMQKNPMRLLALKLLETCKSAKIPTIFFSKEDPPNYAVFLDYAKNCDYICTTAQECVPDYIHDCGHKRVQAVSFGINPVVHNPIGFRTSEKEKTVLFSGSWMLKYPDRCKELSMIFDGILQSGCNLHIIDRNYPGTPKYCFPETYFPYTSPALPNDLLQKVHKLFDWAVNINSVKGSQTMFANRAFELQANGVLLLSNLSVGVNQMLPNVQMVHDSDEISQIIHSLTEEECYERQIIGVRSVMTKHTCFDRVGQILSPLGIHTAQPVRKILVLADVLSESVRKCFEQQTFSTKTLRKACEVVPEELLAYDMIAWFSPDSEYSAFYLEDMANGFKYTACNYITKDAWMEGQVLHAGAEHNYVNQMKSKYRTLFWREAYSPEFLLTIDQCQPLPGGYSIDHFNFDAKITNYQAPKQDYLLSVIIPPCNNDVQLYGKAFSSLRRSSMFQNIEILLALGTETAMAGYLAQRYENVHNCNFDERQCVQAAQAPYVAFLCPENESVGDGFQKMYEIAAMKNADCVVGNYCLADATCQTVNLSEIAKDSIALAAHCKKEPQAIQAAIIKKALAEHWLQNEVDKLQTIYSTGSTVLISYTTT